MGYDLKKDAVDRLVNADKKKYEDPKKDPGKEYRKGLLDRIPSGVLAVIMKWWFAGAVCYFIFWGLGTILLNMEDMILVLGIVLGMVTDILVNNAFRFFETYQGQNSKWMMFPKKAYWTFLANIPYAIIVLCIVMYIYQVINVMGNTLGGTTDQVYLGVEPIFFGLFYVAVDTILIAMKRLCIQIIQDAKHKNGLD